MADNSAAKRSAVTSEIEAIQARRGVQTKTQDSAQDSRFASIKENPVFQIAMDNSVAPEKKVEELRKVMATVGSKTEMAARIEALDQFKAWAQDAREQMASKLMALTDTGTFAELQNVYKDINNDLLKFDDDMKPLIEIIDAVYKIRTSSPNGVTEAYRAIKEAEKNDAIRTENLNDAQKRHDAKKKEIEDLAAERITLSNKKTMFGFGGLSAETKTRIDQIDFVTATKLKELETIAKEIDALSETAQSTLGEGTGIDSKSLEVLRSLLDLSSDEHTNRQKSLVQSAMNFVKTTKTRVGSITDHLGGTDQSLNDINDANQRMTGLYALLNESTSGAKDDILSQRAALATKPEGESKVAELERTEKLRAIDEYIERLEVTSADTDMTYADLSSGSVRINSMRQANRNQINQAKAMQTRGIAGVADRLVTTLQAVSSAAIQEAQAAAMDTNRAMMDLTNRIATNEVIKNATGLDQMNDELKRTFEDLEAYKAAADGATEISRAALTDMRDNLAAMQEAAEAVQQSARDQISAASDTLNGAPGTGTIKTKGITSDTDFFGMKKSA